MAWSRREEVAHAGLQSAGGAHGPHLWGAVAVGEGELSCCWEMQHCWTLSPASGKEK